MKRRTTEEFIAQAVSVHGDKYNYSSVVYINSSTKTIIKCAVHGFFNQRPNDHVVNKAGCPKCKYDAFKKNYSLSQSIFIQRAQVKYGDKFDYSKTVYINMFSKISVICKTHGEFHQQAQTHLNGSIACHKCWREQQVLRQSLSTTDFIIRAHKIHLDRFDYSSTVYCSDKVNIIINCKEHGSFTTTPNQHLYSKRGCPKCSHSKGENLIASFLETKGILYEREKTFNGCRNPKTNRKLRFDFYLPNYNICVEFDGEQHYKENNFFKACTFQELQNRDIIKTKFCANEIIKLVRIPWYEQDNICNILIKNLKR